MTKTISMRMAKANADDIAAAYQLANLLENLGKGYYPHSDSEDSPVFFDKSNRGHLEFLYELLLEIEQKGSLFRVVGGLEVLLDPANAVVDPDRDLLELHPRFAQMMEQQRAEIIQAMGNHINDLVASLKGFIPANLNISNKNLPDSAVIPLDVTMRELRIAVDAIENVEGGRL